MDQKVNYNECAKKVLTQMGLHFSSDPRTDSKGRSYELFAFSKYMKNGSSVKMKLWIKPGGDGKIYCFPVNGVPGSRRTDMLEAMNDRVNHYRFLTLYLDSDSDVNADYDFVMGGGEADCVKQLRSILELYFSVVDDCLPELYKAMWQAKKDPEPEIELKLDLFGNNEEG